jgi:hypothetical protein
VALSAQTVGLRESDTLAAGEMEPIAIGRIVAVETPSMLLVVPENNVVVHGCQLPASSVHRHALVT